MPPSIDGHDNGGGAGRSITGRLGIVAAIVVAAGVLVGSVIAGRFDWWDSAAELDTALVEAPPTQVADIPAADGHSARGVFAQVTSTGHFCLSDAPLGSPLMGGGGCNPVDDPLGGSSVSASLAYDGGPSIETVSDARLIGLASADVAGVRVIMSDDSTRVVRLRKATTSSLGLQTFGYRIRKFDLKKGIGPVAIIALGDDGSEIGRQQTGIG